MTGLLGNVDEARREGHLLVLEQIAAGDELPAILSTLCALVEPYGDGGRALIVVTNEDWASKAVSAGAGFGESLGEEAIARLQALVADAMLRGGEASIEDVRQRAESDPRWNDFERLGVRSILVVPILGSDRGPVAVFALMRREPGRFAPAIVELIQHYTPLASIAIRNDQRERSLLRSAEAIEEAQRIGRFGDLTLDLARKTMVWSDETYLLYEWPRGSPPPALDMFLAFHAPPARARLEEGLHGKGPANLDIEVGVELPSGARGYHRFLLSRVSASLGKEKLTGTVHDVSERRRSQEALQQAQRLESLGLLAGGVAHDFNNLLAALRGNLYIIDRSVSRESPMRTALDAIDGIVLQAASLTRQMLAYAGRATVREELVRFDPLVRDVAALLAAAVPKQIEVRLELDVGDLALLGDAVQIQQVVMNLLTNAVDAIGERYGVVTVRTWSATLRATDVARRFPEQGVNEGPFLMFEVEDTGAGMPPETITRIFDPFFTTKTTGRGLGLSAVRGILRSHGAGFEIDSVLGRGTRFVIAFPTARG